MTVIDGIKKKGRHVVIPEVLKTQALDRTPHQPHGNRKKPSLWHADWFIGLI